MRFELTKAHLALLHEVEEKFPGREITSRFNRFANMVPRSRIFQAWQALRTTPRQGYAFIGVPARRVQTVRRHTLNMMRMSTGKQEHMMAFTHDLPEALITDFCHGDLFYERDRETGTNTPRPDEARRIEIKDELENLAADILFEDGGFLRSLWDEFTDQNTDNARQVKHLDWIELIGACRSYLAMTDLEAETIRDLELFIENGAEALRSLGYKGRPEDIAALPV